MADADNKEATPRTGHSWWDSWWALGFLVAAIFIARFYILEPYKIPSGSMEPTLIGHEDYGDRIVTNKLAYVPAERVWLTLGGAVLFIAFGFLASKAWKSVKSMVLTALLLIGVVGGIFFAWNKEAVASVPKRFEVTVFEYEKAWEDKNENSKVRINYIKRLCGLPGETIVISGGDLFVRNKNDEDQIIRKWKDAPEVQEQFWYAVSKAWMKTTHRQMTDEDKVHLAFPWDVAEAGKPGVRLTENSLELDGSAPVELSYRHQVTNIHIKQGPWPFRHIDCPATRLPGGVDKNGITWRNPKNAPNDVVLAYVNHPSEGVQCPQCQRVVFPLRLGNSGLQPFQRDDPYYDATKKTKQAEMPEFSKFFYGGDDIVGDLKVELELEVESGGNLELEVGSDVHSARWVIGAAAGEETAKVHPVKAATPALAPGRHTLKLAYIDATVIAELDGKEIERQLVDGKPFGREAQRMQSIARLKLDGLKGRIVRLDLFRDNYYLPMLQGNSPNSRAGRTQDFDHGGATNIIRIPEGHYLMLGDNSPSSSDSRIWGTVPEKNIVGRASFIWWPMSRWKTITHGHGEPRK